MKANVATTSENLSLPYIYVLRFSKESLHYSTRLQFNSTCSSEFDPFIRKPLAFTFL